MNINENWKNELIGKCIGCGCEIKSSDTFFEHGGKTYCKFCGQAKMGAVRLRYVEGKAMPLITRDSFSSLPDGIYRLRLYTNLGIRNVMNRIRRLVCDNLSDVYFSDDFDRSRCIVRMISADLAIVGVEDKDGRYEFTA